MRHPEIRRIVRHMRSIPVLILLLLACSSGAKRTELTPAELKESREESTARSPATTQRTRRRSCGASAPRRAPAGGT